MNKAWLGFEARVALRFLREGRMQTVLIMVGVAAGVAVITYISVLISALQVSTVTKTLGSQAHVVLQPLDDVVTPAAERAQDEKRLSDVQPRAQRLRSVPNWQLLLPLLEKMPGMAGVSPMVSGGGLALRGEASQSVSVMGVELERYERIVGLRGKLVSGQARLGPGEAIVGRQLAQDLGLRVGDRLTVQAAAVSETVRVSALVDMGALELNRRAVIMPLRDAQSLLELPGGVSSIELSLRDVWAAQAVAEELRRRYPYKVESWQETNAQLLSALNAQSISTGVIRGVVLVVVVLGIASVLVVSVVQKGREIGILRAMGATRSQISRVFLLQGAMLGSVGSLFGLMLALLLIWLFSAFVRGSDGLPLFRLDLPSGLALQTAVLATVCGVLAAIAPARRAASMDPAQAIRV